MLRFYVVLFQCGCCAAVVLLLLFFVVVLLLLFCSSSSSSCMLLYWVVLYCCRLTYISSILVYFDFLISFSSLCCSILLNQPCSLLSNHFLFSFKQNIFQTVFFASFFFYEPFQHFPPFFYAFIQSFSSHCLPNLSFSFLLCHLSLTLSFFFPSFFPPFFLLFLPGEKIMLAIITRMTLTQVSTWFANARRRLKKVIEMVEEKID